MDIKVLKLKNGENLVAEINNKDNHGRELNNQISIKNPVGLVLGPQGIYSVDWLAMCEQKTVFLHKDDLLVDPMEPSEEIKNSYNETFGTGLIISGRGLKI